MNRFISFSGGVESTAMCVLYGKGATAIFCDTGAEPDEMYQRIDFCEKALLELHGGDFRLHRIKASVMAKGKVVDSLLDYILQYGYMPSPTQPGATRQNLKSNGKSHTYSCCPKIIKKSGIIYVLDPE